MNINKIISKSISTLNDYNCITIYLKYKNKFLF